MTDWLLISCALLAVVATLVVAGVVAPALQERRIKAGKQCESEGTPSVFTLSLGEETVALESGKPWVHVDRYKWVTRGLIEEPQSFHILRDGTVEINGEKIRLDDPDGVVKLEFEINKHHTAVVSPKSPTVLPSSPATVTQTHGQSPDKVRFKVKLDQLGHLMIDCLRGAERVETGMRGISTLIKNGLMLKPGSLHLDPLQRGIEIDGARFESSEAGARQLQETLNARYAPTLNAAQEGAVEIRENPASPTGFDIHFVTFRVGARFDVKGHLNQEQLEILQNPAKCNLLQHGVVLRLSPPHLLVRRKRPDGGEERIPEMPDIDYLRVTCRQLQQFLNHPLIRRTGSKTAAESPGAAEPQPEEKEIMEMPESQESQSSFPTATPPTASETGEETASPKDQCEISTAPALQSAGETTGTSAPKELPATVRAEGRISEAPGGTHLDATILALCSQTDPMRVNAGIFRRLAVRFGVAAQDVLLSLPWVFTDRRFEIINFEGKEIGSVLELRGEEFYGFYLAHLSEQRIDFVYACRGTHLEWGPDKCVLQPSAGAEAMEFAGSALLAMAQTRENQFVFVVTPAYQQWAKPHEARCRQAFAHLLTVNDLATDPDSYTFIWPERPQAQDEPGRT